MECQVAAHFQDNNTFQQVTAEKWCGPVQACQGKGFTDWVFTDKS